MNRVVDYYRSTLNSIKNLLGGLSGYDSGKADRLTKLFQNINENSIDSGQLQNLEANAKDLWRNNPHARKIVRQIQTKTVGTGMRPIPQALNADKTAFVSFRKRAKEVWSQFICQSDSRGKPGKGGQHFNDQSKAALAAVVRSGNVLHRIRNLNRAEQRRRGAILPVTVQLIDADRLDGTISQYEENEVFRGIELNSGLVSAYHLLDKHPSEKFVKTESTRIPSSEIGHVFVGDDIDQYFGVSWFAPILGSSRDVSDYTYNELKAAVLSSCVVMGVKGFGGRVPGARSASGTTEDSLGNALKTYKPGQIMQLPKDGSIEGFDPKRPNTNATEFINQLLMLMSTGVPGVKGTTLTGDYRGSSFSSEKSADNEIWPEVEAIQQWWSCSYNQPIYEEVITAAVRDGLFADVISDGEFAARKHELLQCKWQGPVAKSINPKDDQAAARLGLKNLTSSVQVEAGKQGRDALENLQDLEDFVEQVMSLNIEDSHKQILIANAMGQDVQVVSSSSDDDEEDAPNSAGSAEAEAIEDNRSLALTERF